MSMQVVSKQLVARAAVVSLAVGLASGCTTLQVKSDVNQPLAASVKCQSFDWAGSFHGSSDLRSTVANPVNEARLRTAIQANLGTLGIRQSSENPDCLVGYGIGNRDVVDGWAYPGPGPGWGWGAGYGWGHRGWAYGAWGYDYPYVYQQGVIGVDLYDNRSKQALWHATANQNLTNVSGEKADQKIKEAVAAIFTRFPR
jgi:hypothetical protein